MKDLHPDKNGNTSEANQLSQQIIAAWKILNNPIKETLLRVHGRQAITELNWTLIDQIWELKRKRDGEQEITSTHNTEASKPKLLRVLERSTRRGETKVKVAWNNGNQTWINIQDLKEYPEQAKEYLEDLKTYKPASYRDIKAKHGDIFN